MNALLGNRMISLCVVCSGFLLSVTSAHGQSNAMMGAKRAILHISEGTGGAAAGILKPVGSGPGLSEWAGPLSPLRMTRRPRPGIQGGSFNLKNRRRPPW